MTKLLLILLLVPAWLNGITRISRTNELKKAAQSAYHNKQYKQAADAWSQILAETKNPEPEIRLNLAHAYLRQNQNVKAAREYQQVVRESPAALKSIAQQQLGNLHAQTADYEAALSSYKEALKSNPKNRSARYNYELLKKYLEKKNNEPPAPEEENKEQNKPQPDQSTQQSSDSGGSREENNRQQGQGQQQPTPSGNSPGDESGQTPDPGEADKPSNPSGQRGEGNTPGEETTKTRLEQIRMSEDKARQLLEAMRQAEQQYLQQVPRGQKVRQQKGKPDW